MSRFSSPSRAPRRGQALLLAVLIMIFAALLSASFLVVVSVNLNQTARQTDKNRASVAAQAGLSQISHQLAYSPEGDHWRSELENVPPAPGDASYSFYYTPMEIAQDWARKTPHPLTDLNGNGKVYNGIDPATIDPGDEKIALDATRSTGKLELVKSPDPRGTGGQINEAPSFLSQVERVPNNGNPDLAGALKVTVIGLSSEDPTAFSRVVAYKGGFRRSPIGQVMRTVSNYNFKNNVVPVAQVATYDATTNPAAPTLTFQSKDDSFISLEKPLYATVPTVSAMPFTITLSNPKTGVPARFVVVRDIALTTAATSTTPATYTLTLASTVPVPAPVAGERIELAATLGAPNGINYSNSVPATPVTLYDNISDTNKDLDPTTTAAPNQVDGARINGSLIVTGNLFAARLRALADSFGGTNLVPGTVAASGVIAPENGSVLTMNVAGSAGATDSVKGSDSTSIFSSSMPTVPNRESLVSDGWNRLSGVPSANVTTRAVPEFVPPTFSSGEGLNRYRNLARFSASTGSNPANAALYGYGIGIYLDNIQDTERIYDTATSKYRDMTQAELIQMWLSKVSETTPPAATNFMRTDAPLALAMPGSLEQKHLRGWVGPDEFRARGVEIELGNGVITITRDARDDDYPLGTSPKQAWRQPDGTVPVAGNAIYTQILPWPTTGVIFAEGNVRIKGNGTNAPNSLTVVSMGNIYIEDSLSIDDATDGINVGNLRKILLMPKKNGILNPTRVMGRPDAQTLTPVISAQTLTDKTPTMLSVVDAAAFHKGDFFQTATITGTTETISAQGYVTADPIFPFAQLAVTPTLITTTATVAGASVVRTPMGTTQLVTAGAIMRAVPAIASNFDAIQRRLFLPASLFPRDLTSTGANIANLRIAFNHQIDRVPGFNVEIEKAMATTTKPTSPVYFSNKGVPINLMPPYFDVQAAVVGQGDKKLRSQFTSPVTGNDDFPGTAPTSETEAMDATRNLTGISTQMNSNSHIDPDVMASPRVGWQYKTTVPTPFVNLPFFYLAGVGNRYDFGVAPTGETRKDINDGTMPAPVPASEIPYMVPMGNSIGFTLNSVFSSTRVPFFDEHYNPTVMMPMMTPAYYDKTTQFGFSPTFLDPSTAANMRTEDVLTSDQGFYQTDGLKSTLDSRSLCNADPAILAAAATDLVPGQNSLVLRQSDGLVQPATGTDFPAYRLMDAKLENVKLTGDDATGKVTTTSIGTGYTFNVNAYVYAQTGSWFIIPGPLFDERLKTATVGTATIVFLDSNNDNAPNAGEYITDASGNGFPDFNRNGVVDEAEKFATTRYLRFNYQINFIGAIAENQTALVNTVYDTSTPPKIVQPGAVDDWMNKWATTVSPPPASGDSNNRIHYVFDPTVALNNFQVSDEGFKLPQTTEVFYQD